MRIINFKTKLNESDCDKFLKSKIITDGEIGINRVYHRNNKIVLYYEDGSKTARDIPPLLKSCFVGRLKKKYNAVFLQGIIISGPVTLILLVLMFCFSLFQLLTDENTAMFIPILLSVVTIEWIFVSEKKNRQKIYEYLEGLK